jgi:hypothetical protein
MALKWQETGRNLSITLRRGGFWIDGPALPAIAAAFASAFGPVRTYMLIGATEMKKILIVAAAAGLMSLTACGGATTNTAAENAVESHEANAEVYDDAAANAATPAEANALENAADVEENKAEAAENAM